ncbi:hypothetical protein BDEG_20513 [Batrachochytrium dendrobatidis JEL423]|uniref:Uncharacterized protein n=1 Tax=Batrachochytrium dendrobatidis (strain JEL423) TaxID=403673 RepID=A0A177W892_BATDL|nr:hypothetical protein BDEG_20513 [Batrachochytrium dendrobatidis JEL423]
MGAFYSFRALQLTYKELDLGRRLYRDPRIIGALEHVPQCVYDYNRDYRRLITAVLVNGPKSRAARIFRQRTLEVDKIMQCSSDEDEAKSTHTQVSSKQDATQRGKTVVDEPTLVAYYLASTHGKRMSNIYNLGIWQNIMQVCFPQSLDLNQNKR